MIRLALGSLIVLACLAGACASWSEDEKKNETPPRDWSWLALARTTREQIIERAGKPAATWKTVLQRGRLEANPSPNYSNTGGAFGIPLPRVVTDPKREVEAEVLSYTNAGESSSLQYLILIQGKLLYTVLPPLAEESSVAAILEKFACEPRSFKTRHGEGCIQGTFMVMEFTAERTAFLCATEPSGAVTEVTQKLRWPGAKDMGPELECEWSLPEEPAKPPADKKEKGK